MAGEVPLEAPPDYNEVVSSPVDSVSHQPSAPPISDIRPAQDYPPPGPRSPPAGGGAGGPAPRHRASADQTDSGRKKPNILKRYVAYSIPQKLRMYMNPDDAHEDPELDVEAQFSRHVVREAQMAIAKKRRLQCISGWLWCIGALQTLCYIALPIAMLVTGIFAIIRVKCPIRSNTISIYLVLGGSLLSVLVLIRILTSLLTCGRNKCGAIYRDCFITSAGTCEIFFYAILIVNLVILCLGTYWIFSEMKPQDCMFPEEDYCCETAIYIASAVYNVFQYLLYVVSVLYVCLTVCCIRSMDTSMKE